MGDLYRLDLAESKFGNHIAPSPTIFEREAFKIKNYVCTKYIPVSAVATSRVSYGHRTSIGRGFTRSWQVRGKTKIFQQTVPQSHTWSSGWVERRSLGIGPPRKQGSAIWIMASAEEPSRNGCGCVILQGEAVQHCNVLFDGWWSGILQRRLWVDGRPAASVSPWTVETLYRFIQG